MPLHLSSSGKTGSKPPPARQNAGKSGVNKSTSVNRSTTFGLGASQWKIRDESHAANLLENLRVQREKKEFTDITFTYEGETFSANRVILAALSPVMRNVFMKREDVMNGEVLPPDALRHTILFIYNASTEVKLDVIKKIEKVSRVLQIHTITTTCSNLLSTIPEFTDDDNDGVTTKRLRQIPRQKTLDSTASHESTPLHHQSSADSNKSVETTDGNNISASDISDILVGTKKGNRASIRLTIHTESETPLSRSSEDVSQLKQSTSPENNNKVPNLKSTLSMKERDKNWEEKRKNFAQKKSSHIPPEKSPNPKSRSPPLLLSKLIQEAQSTNSDTISRTWPKRGASGTPKREKLPQHWEQSTGPFETSQTISRQSKRNSQDAEKSRLTQDKYIIKFKSGAVPNLLKGLNSLREQGLFCDVILVVGNTRINCHRSILAASSAVFRTILTQVVSKEIVMKKIDEAAIVEIIKFIYTSQCSIDRDNVMMVMKGCLHFRLDFVARKCVGYLDEYATSSQNFFSTENVLSAFKLAGEFGFQKLREESRKYAVSRFWDLIDTKSFRDLPWADLSRLLSNETLRNARRDHDQEYRLYRGLLQWLNHAPQSRASQYTSSTMKYVVFMNIRGEDLSQIVAKGGIVMQQPELRQRVLDAVKQRTTFRSHSLQLPRSPLPGLQGEQIESAEDVHAFVFNTNDSNATSNCIYNLTPPENNSSFVTKSPAPRIGCAVTSYRGNIYVAGGREGVSNKKVCKETYRFNPTKGWTQLPNMSIPRSHFAIIPLDGALCAIGGLSENQEKQYVVSTTCETLELESDNSNPTWKITSWTLAQPSYSHAAVCCVLSRDDGSNESNTPEFKSESKKKATGSPGRRRGIRLSAPFIDVKSPLLNRASPKHGTGKNKKNQNTERKSADLMTAVFVCGGKINPKQNLVLFSDSSTFIEKSPLPNPCTSLSMTSSRFKVFIACDDVMATSQFCLYEYSPRVDQWSEVKLPIRIVKPLSNPNTNTASNDDDSPRNTSISCASTSTGVAVAVCVDDVMHVEQLNTMSMKWRLFSKTKLQNPAVEFRLCSL